jgi:hypothetical protein
MARIRNTARTDILCHTMQFGSRAKTKLVVKILNNISNNEKQIGDVWMHNYSLFFKSNYHPNIIFQF